MTVPRNGLSNTHVFCLSIRFEIRECVNNLFTYSSAAYKGPVAENECHEKRKFPLSGSH